ncbi:MAG: hypothetical protein JXX29_20540 [Deltaproteobacteria bacterium]|nr:hypothetical protein [Deltaproteobacteria bacterium]MBN2674081.1 hypothetical protein [Deltaproteobacteria bacterium]
MTKAKSIEKLRKHLAKLFDARYEGTSRVCYAETQGFIDGYMEAMEDLHFVSNKELLRIVAEERQLAAARADAALPSLASQIAVEHFA